MKDITFKLGLEDQAEFSGQALRAFMDTKLANDASVSIKESIAALQHNSVSAHCTYIERSAKSELNKYRALGLLRNVN